MAAVLQSTKQMTGVGKIGSVSREMLSNFARFILAVNQLIMHENLVSLEFLAFSITLDFITYLAI